MCKGKCQNTCANPCTAKKDALSSSSIELRDLRAQASTGLKPRQDDGPIKGTVIAQRMAEICGCEGKFDCNCVTIENQARVALWTEHNQRQATNA